MWAGKVAIIMYLFSIGCLFGGYYANQVFNNTTLNNNQALTYNSLQTLAGSFNLNQQINTNLIFGDFIAGLTVLFSIVTGTTIASAFSVFPFVGAAEMLLIQITFALSSALLWIYIVSNRSV